MSIYFDQAEALHFQLKTVGAIDTLLAREQFAHIDEEMIGMMLEQAARFSEDKLEELAARGDREGCRLHDGRVTLPKGTADTYREWCELGFSTLGLPLEAEGMGFPTVVQSAVQEIGDAANMAFGMLSINLRCAAKALQAAASQEQLDHWLPALMTGELATTIVISEPQAGSDVGRIRSQASLDETGQWRLNGSKIWISYGDHDATDNILHLVLARTPEAEPGTRGLSLFAVPRDIKGGNNGVSVLRLEEKMGLHASPTCVLEFESSQATLIGEQGKGIRNLFTMMNAMRLAVAVQGAGVANAATLHAIDYARERPQGGRPDQPPVMISEHDDVKRMLLDMSARAELLRALALRTASWLDQAETAQTADEADEYRRLAELLLPIAKTLGAEWGFEVANQGMQVLGGYGYTNDYPLERMTRDIRVASVYEGTSGIQALDFVKRKLLADELQTMNRLLAMIRDDLSAATEDNPLRTPLAAILGTVDASLATLTETSRQGDAGCYPLLRLCGLLAVCWNGLTLHEAATGGSPYQQRLRAALRHYATGLEEEAESWAARAAVGSIDLNF